MKILILEDDWDRIMFFKELFAGKDNELHITKSVDKAKKFLQNYVYDLIMLDHDLEVEHYMKDCPNDLTTGYGLACFLEENKECNPDTQIIIHSLNWNGRARMMQALRGRNVIEMPYDVRLMKRAIKL